MPPLRSLGERGDHGAARGHVDAGRQGLGREDHLHETLLEELLDQLLPGRQDSGVVGRNAAQQGIVMAPVPHRLRSGRHEGIQALLDPGLLLGGHQADLAQIAHGLVAAASAEDEIDGREHLPLRHLRHHEAQRWGLGLRGSRGFRSAAVAPFGGPPDLAVRVKPCSLVVEQGMEALGAAEAELQRHRPEVAHDEPGRPVDRLDPIGQLPGIGHRRREGHQLHHRRAMNDRFLPDRPALGVVHVVALIEHHGLHVGQGVIARLGLGVQHVPEDLRGHHDDGGLPIHGEVPGHQTDAFRPELLAEVPQLLVREGLERRCVKDLLTVGQGAVNGVLTNQGLARAGGGTHHHGVALIQGLNRLQLKVIEAEGEQLLEGRHL